MNKITCLNPDSSRIRGSLTLMLQGNLNFLHYPCITMKLFTYIMFSIILSFFSLFCSISNGQECVRNELFEVTSINFPQSNGCYHAERIDSNSEIVFTSSTDNTFGSNVLLVSPEGDQYFLLFYGSDGLTVFCSANVFDFVKPHHPIEISEKGWGWNSCQQDLIDVDVDEHEFVLTCGCKDEEFVDDGWYLHDPSQYHLVYQLSCVYVLSLAVLGFASSKICYKY